MAAELALRDSEARMRGIIAVSPVPIITVDLAGTVQNWNPAAERMFGWTEAEVMGRLTPIIPLEHQDEQHALLQQTSVDLPEMEVRRLRRDGALLDLRVSAAPLYDARGQLSGIMGMYIDLMAQKQVLHQVEQARDAAEELARLRSDFVVAVSHELRTPLTAMIGFGELLQSRWSAQRGTAPGNRWPDRPGGARQQRLVEDLLLLTQIETARLDLEGETLPVATLVQAAAVEMQGRYPGQHVKPEGPDDLSLWAEPARARQIMVNLLDNAAKYSPEGRPLSCRGRGKTRWRWCAYGTRDPGIPDERHGQLFTRFGRVQGSRMRAGHVGTGLGLYLGRNSPRRWAERSTWKRPAQQGAPSACACRSPTPRRGPTPTGRWIYRGCNARPAAASATSVGRERSWTVAACEGHVLLH